VVLALCPAVYCRRRLTDRDWLAGGVSGAAEPIASRSQPLIQPDRGEYCSGSSDTKIISLTYACLSTLFARHFSVCTHVQVNDGPAA